MKSSYFVLLPLYFNLNKKYSASNFSIKLAPESVVQTLQDFKIRNCEKFSKKKIRIITVETNHNLMLFFPYLIFKSSLISLKRT